MIYKQSELNNTIFQLFLIWNVNLVFHCVDSSVQLFEVLKQWWYSLWDNRWWSQCLWWRQAYYRFNFFYGHWYVSTVLFLWYLNLNAFIWLLFIMVDWIIINCIQIDLILSIWIDCRFKNAVDVRFRYKVRLSLFVSNLLFL